MIPAVVDCGVYYLCRSCERHGYSYYLWCEEG